MNDVWLSKLNADEVGQPYIDVRAHRAFWEGVERIAQSKKTQLNDVLIGGNLSQANEITRDGLENLDKNSKFFFEKYKIKTQKD